MYAYARPVHARGLSGPGDNAALAKQSGSLASAGLLISAAVVGGPVGAVIAGAAAAVQALTALFVNVFSGCGQTCVEATHVVDTVESQYLKPNVANYFAQPVRTKAMQDAALQVFDYAWSIVLRGCGDPQLGEAGMRCISERQRGGVSPWCTNPGKIGCDWFALYRDPIANDPNVMPDPNPIVNAASGVESLFSGSSFNWSSLLLPAAIFAGALWILD